MATPYDHTTIERKWQDRWRQDRAFATPDPMEGQERAYILDMFPYPSGAGLHVGHLLGYTGSDVLARTARKQGKAVLHPMGWDAFGLPAENYAIKSGVHPAVSTAENIENFKRQFAWAGISYDWEREINTSQPEYYRWTQWLFQLLYKRGLAYRKNGLVNWCPKDQTVLANEQVVGGACERCGTPVVQKEMKQWYFKITDYAERLLNDVEALDWPERIKAMQRNWIGRSEGAYLNFSTKSGQIKVFTTRPDTLHGATFLVLAPEHGLVGSLTSEEQAGSVGAYVRQAAQSSELERTFADRPKTGVWTGSFATHPLTGDQVPVWIADYVLATYGTGAIMAVPAHDGRDRTFAEAYGLPIREMQPADPVETARMIEAAMGNRAVTYRLRDWLVSRQRYWGVPIPVLYDADGRESLVPDDQLPVVLPERVAFKPNGESPLAAATEWNTLGDLRREVDTLDTFVCSSWYYLRYPTPHLAEAAFDREQVRQWLPVDTYVGGAEHAVLHLLYARFITKVLFDAGLVDFHEPFLSLRNQGMILGPDHQKMSKSKGNVINPDDVISEYGADTLRTYELFMAPFDAEKPWSVTGILGSRRFLDRVWNLQERLSEAAPSPEEQRLIHPLVRRVTQAIGDCKFNVAIAAMMETLNGIYELPSLSRSGYRTVLSLLNPFAPHVTEEAWSLAGGHGFCSLAAWPEPDPRWLSVDAVEYVVQINGKVRQRLTLDAALNEPAVLQAVLADPTVQRNLEGRPISRHVFVPGRLVSLVA